MSNQATLQDGITALTREANALRRKMGETQYPAIRSQVGGQIDGINKAIKLLGALAAGRTVTLEEAEKLPEVVVPNGDVEVTL